MPGKIAYRPAEAAEQLGISRGTLYALMRSGEIRSFNIGTSRLVPHEELVAYTRRKQELSVAAA